MHKITASQKAILCLALILGSVPAAYAIITSLTIPGSVTVTRNVNVKAYWDQACTQPVTSIDVGSKAQGSRVEMTIYLKNEAGSTVTLDWSSDLTSKSGNYVGDDWVWFDGTNWQTIRNKNLDAGAVLATKYSVVIATTCPPGTYSWTLSLGSA